MRITIKKIVVAAVLLLVFTQVAFLYIRSPSSWYESVTGEKLPTGVRAIQHAWVFNDNVFRVSHYWKFEHTDNGLEELLKNLGVESGYEKISESSNLQELDSPWVLPSMQKALSQTIKVVDIERGYEIEGPRDDWLLVSKGGHSSFLEWNN